MLIKTRNTLAVVLSFCILLLAGVSSANEAIINAPEVKKMIEEEQPVLLVNVLSQLEYESLHITGSINIPIDKLKSSNLLPEDKNTPVIFYCMGHR